MHGPEVAKRGRDDLPTQEGGDPSVVALGVQPLVVQLQPAASDRARLGAGLAATAGCRSGPVVLSNLTA